VEGEGGEVDDESEGTGGGVCIDRGGHWWSKHDVAWFSGDGINCFG
jgi:hypothetical protein